MNAYNESGIEGVKKHIGKTEICFFSDNFSEKVVTLVNEGKDRDANDYIACTLNRL